MLTITGLINYKPKRKKPLTNKAMTNAEKLKLYRAEAKAKGYCTACRKRSARSGRNTCGECLNKE